ncbi:MAG: 30S ribosomal protein S18 [Candidatus Pacebacteria bacterium]|nr:30S ribosomal protein S18 [Candidatus Paceibacterota bacterium]
MKMNNCYFCKKNINEIDFKDTNTLQNYISRSSKLKNKKKTNLCTKHQRKVALAVKRARFLALMPYIPE